MNARIASLATVFVADLSALALPVASVRAAPTGQLPLRFVADVPLPGGSSRFDYQSLDAGRNRLYVSHLAAGDALVFDVKRRRVSATIPDLPGVHGDEVCRQIVAGGSQSRVLMLTAASTVRERVDGLGLGADDYLPKPFDFAELVARVRALGRRSAPALPPTLEGGGVTLDPSRRVAFRAGRRLELSPKEFAVLECLLAAGGRVVSAEELLEQAWDEAADPFTTTVKATINRLRSKLGDPPVIETVSRAGYRI